MGATAESWNQVKPTLRVKCPSLRLSTPPSAWWWSGDVSLNGGGGNGMPQVPAGLTPLPADAVMALLAAAAVLIAAIAAATTVQRDIT